MPIIETERLILRQWNDSDRTLFAALNQDSEVMRYFPRPLSVEESNAFVDKSIHQIRSAGYGLMAAEIKSTHEFIGFIGLANPSFDAHFTPCTEIGWRLHRPFWKQGYATEGAKAVLTYAFEELRLESIVSFTALTNTPSIAVMKRIGMRPHPQQTFEHPLLPEGHGLRTHVLYERLRATPVTSS